MVELTSKAFLIIIIIFNQAYIKNNNNNAYTYLNNFSTVTEMLLKQRFLTILILDTFYLLFTVIIFWSKVHEIFWIQHAQRFKKFICISRPDHNA